MSFTNQELAIQILKRLKEKGHISDYEPTGASEELGAMLGRYAEKAVSMAKSAAPEQAPVLSEGSPQKGDRVRIVAGKKCPIGTEGELFWMREKEYNGKRVIRIGVKDDTGTPHWTDLRNVEKVTA